MKTTTRITLMVSVCVLVLGVVVQSAVADTEANKATIRRVLEEAWNQGQLGVIDEVVAPTYVYHEPAIGDIPGPAGLQQTILGYRMAYPDLHFTIDDLIAEDDLVAMRWTAAGTHQGELMGIPATGLATTTVGINITRYDADGKVVEEWSTWDVLSLMQQLSVVPADHDYYVWGDPAAVTGDGGNPQTNTVKVISYTEEVWNRKRVDQLEATHSADVVVHNPMLPDQPFGIDRYREATEGFVANMPDMNVEFHRFVAEGDMVAAHYTATGTYLPSGKKVAFSGVTWYRFADGKVVENWWMYDAYGMMQQMIAGPEWTPEGTWIVTVPSPMGNFTLIHVIAPVGAGGRHSGVAWQVNPNPTNFGMFPDFTSGGQFYATETVRTAPNTYETGMVVYTTQTGDGLAEQIGGIDLANVTWTITGPDTNEGTATLATYLAGQDADGDGLPDEGQEPAVCIPYTFTSRRVKIPPACVPTPMPE